VVKPHSHSCGFNTVIHIILNRRRRGGGRAAEAAAGGRDWRVAISVQRRVYGFERAPSSGRTSGESVYR